ncbi:PAS domain S-box protein [Pseudaminobacter sp. NGMCC 1.201702]|uniref:PAS domain S-box protein n=1 Tax=Pseudaminobacter sp. NGMCC 1.201702 TaxID=3391825 RepID=UPI0039EF0A4C
MPSASYSFIDVVVLDEVRERFANGDAMAILSADLDQVIWANGPGAQLLGYSQIEAIIGASPMLSSTAKRQIMATSGFPEIGRDRRLLVRLATGAVSRAVAFLASALKLPDGEAAILLAAPAEAGQADSAALAISGLSEPGHFAALVGAAGEIRVASESFAGLGISQQTLASLVGEVSGERDRLVKRMIAGANHRFPAGLARLVDEPALHLLVVVDERRQDDGDLVGQNAVETHDHSPPTAIPDVADASSPEVSEDIPAGPGTGSSEHDTWYFSSSGEAARQAPDPAPSEPVMPDRDAAPVRFVWRTDADGHFSQISDEFVDAVGANAADVIGRRFRDVANAFGLDPSGEISELLERRDTWSGRSVLWPVAGTGMKIPVDLAALPVYGRERNFEGFRGFGVARVAEAVEDPEKIGLVLVSPPSPAEPQVEPDEEVTDTAPQPSDPFQGEVPALSIAPQPDRRFTDKVIRLAEHRPPAPEKGLSTIERSAFREIGERLKRESEAAKAREGAEGAPPEAPAEDIATSDTDTAPLPPMPDIAASPASEADSKVNIGDEEQAQPAVDSLDKEVDSDAAQAPADQKQETAPTARPSASLPSQDVTITPANGNARTETPLRRMAEGFTTPAEEPREAAATSDMSVLERLPVPVLIHSGDVLHYANEEFLTLTAYRSVEHLTEAGGLDALFAESYADEDTPAAERELRLRTGDGLEFPIEALLRSVPWQGGKALMLVVRRTGDLETPPLTADLQSPAQAELRAQVAEMRTIIDTATDGVVLIASDGTIRSISRPAEALFGFDSDEVAGKSFASLFAMESQGIASDYLNGLTDHGVASVLNDGREVIGREAQGRFIPLFMTIGRLPNESGFCAVVRDITQWKRAEEELTKARMLAERASSQKTDFLARISHEIRTPLNAIIGFSELMIDEKFGPVANDRYRDYLRDINRSGNHVLDLVNDLLDISKIEAGQQEMAYEAVSLNDTLAETVAMMQPQANRERVIIRSSLASKLPDVVADPRSVRQIALNVLSNAIRYTQAGGQVVVSTAYETSGDVVMRVRDTGIGMTQAEIEQALKPFKQINSLKRARGDGTGLGLPLTKAMVEANRAKFVINSTPGEGTLVEVAFPSTRVLAD